MSDTPYDEEWITDLLKEDKENIVRELLLPALQANGRSDIDNCRLLLHLAVRKKTDHLEVGIKGHINEVSDMIVTSIMRDDNLASVFTMAFDKLLCLQEDRNKKSNIAEA